MEEVKLKIKRNSRSCILISLKDGVEFPFLAYTEADDFLGQRHGYIRACLRNGNKISKLDPDTDEIEYFDIIQGPKNRTQTVTERFPDQLCWRCKNACGNCSWSRDFKPVLGWTAVETFKDGNITYSVTKCPAFKPEKIKKRSINEAYI